MKQVHIAVQRLSGMVEAILHARQRRCQPTDQLVSQQFDIILKKYVNSTFNDDDDEIAYFTVR